MRHGMWVIRERVCLMHRCVHPLLARRLELAIIHFPVSASTSAYGHAIQGAHTALLAGIRAETLVEWRESTAGEKGEIAASTR